MHFSVNQNLLKKVDGLRKSLSFGLLPARCLMCEQAGPAHTDLCAACYLELPHNHLHCPVCALPLAAPASACGECLKKPPAFNTTVAPFLYQAAIASLQPRYKYHQDLPAGRLLAELFCQHSEHLHKPDAIVPVPLHINRLRQRGFDQALELAKIIANNKAIPLLCDLLKRQRNTSAQSFLNASQRHHNLRNAFVASGRSMPAHIALVDDVMTTGTTVRECAKVLLKAGAKRVDVWVIARVAAP
jgi:ComF family protein